MLIVGGDQERFNLVAVLVGDNFDQQDPKFITLKEELERLFKKKKLNYYIELMELIDWRVYKPYHLFKKIDDELMKRLD